MLWSTNTTFLQHCDPITTLQSRKRTASTKLAWALVLTANITVANAWIPPVQTSRKRLDSIAVMGATLSNQEHAHGRHHANENEIHDNTRQSINSSSHEPHVESSIIDQNRHNHSEADTVDTASTEDWQRVCERFKNQLLDDSFLVYPIRGHTVEAADQYPHEDDAPPRLMPGTHKHLGGAYDATDGCIYGVPANSRCVLCLYPEKDKKSYGMKTIPLPKEIQEVRMKWLRGIFAHGYLWAIPSWAPKVLCVDIDAYWGRRPAEKDGDGKDKIVHLLDLPDDYEPTPSKSGTIWQWHGAGINHEKTAIYCIPSNAREVLKVDCQTKQTSLIPVQVDTTKYADLDLSMTNKWYGGIVGVDNAVYGIPYRSSGVLRIDAKTDSAKVVGQDFGCGKFNWHGGICVNGKIYAHPSHADTLLMIDTNKISEDGEPEMTELTIHHADYDQDPRKNYKWLGGSVGIDGNIYCPACDTSAVLKVDTKTDHCSTFGFAGKTKNKWQGGVLSKTRDGCIYCIPASGTQILRIPTHPDTLNSSADNEVVQLLGDLPVHKDKFQGGYEGMDGCLYFIPENGYRVLRVSPPLKPPKIVDGKLPDDDVVIEMM